MTTPDDDRLPDIDFDQIADDDDNRAARKKRYDLRRRPRLQR